MKNLIFLLLTLFVFEEKSHSSETAKSVYNNFSQNIVYIESKFNTGTGFFLSPETIITNRHVVYGLSKDFPSWNAPKKIILKNKKEISSYAYLVCSNRVDICIIGLNKNDYQRNLKANIVARKINPGEDVFIIGHPAGILSPVLSTGIISSDYSNIPWTDITEKPSVFLGFTTNAAISGGSSGSPVISKDNEFLGIAVGTLKDTQNLNIVISSNEIINFVNDISNKNISTLTIFTEGFEETQNKYTHDFLASKIKTEIENSNNSLINNGPYHQNIEKPKYEKDEIDSLDEEIIQTDYDTKEPFMAGTPVEKIYGATLDTLHIKKLLKDSVPLLSACYQDAINKKIIETKNSQIILDLEIDSNGKVFKTDISSGDELPVQLKVCITTNVNAISFPAIEKGTYSIRQPVNLKPKRIRGRKGYRDFV